MIAVAVSLFAAAVVQGLCNNGAIPLYYELAIESTYPVAEVVTSMMMTVMYNVLPLIFLAINYTTEEYGEQGDHLFVRSSCCQCVDSIWTVEGSFFCLAQHVSIL